MKPKSSIRTYRSVENPFFMEFIEKGTDLENLRYYGRGEAVYADGRQVLVRSCHDFLISYQNQDDKKEERGIILIKRKAEPANGYLWPLGGFYDRGVPSTDSIASRLKSESSLDVDQKSLLILGHIRNMWKTTPHKEAEIRKLPLGTDDTVLLWYGKGEGKIVLDELHEMPLIVTLSMYTEGFRSGLHPYVQLGMDRAIKLI